MVAINRNGHHDDNQLTSLSGDSKQQLTPISSELFRRRKANHQLLNGRRLLHPKTRV